jgi:(E)-4-hydroxy-3-methylbut-2-enyl-diphosphate synthase
MEAAQNLGNIIKEINIPLVADIHFDYKLALEAIKQGISALRLNPGNIGGEEKVRAVVKAAKEAHIISPIYEVALQLRKPFLSS